MGFRIFMFFICFGSIAGMFAAINVWNSQTNVMTQPTNGMNSSTFSSLQSNNEGALQSVFTPWIVLAQSLVVLASAILSCMVSLPLMFSVIGFPINWYTAIIVQAIQAPFTATMILWLIELWTGRVFY